MAKLTSESSKADEIQALHEMAERCGKGSYLADLFTPRMIGYITRQINLDGSCDLHEAMMVETQRTKAVKTDNAAMRGRIGRLEYWNAQRRAS